MGANFSKINKSLGLAVSFDAVGVIITHATDPAISAEIKAEILQSPFLMHLASLGTLALICLTTLVLQDCEQQAKKV
jgi:hypothetical protein